MQSRYRRADGSGQARDLQAVARPDAWWTPLSVRGASEAARVIQIPHRAPDANAFAESFIGTIKRECLDFFVCFSRSQFDYILRTWVRHYNVERPHRGRDIGNNVLQVDFRPVRDGPIRRNRQLGGIITSYTRDAA
jgi:putative transposase